MSKHIYIGRAGKEPIALDLKTLLRTRALVTANSGGGKSWMLRRMAEQLFGKVPVWIVDPEGEFATLREKFGFVLVGKGGETPADPRTAPLVCQKLRELNASAVFDLYDLKPAARHAWVRIFFETLMNLPKSLWRPLVLKLDEAQVFAPEKGQGESEANLAVQDVATRGRKRGICLIPYTQRLAKISKTVTAELLNRFVGMTREGIDIDRAVEVLSVARQERDEFRIEVKKRAPGEFYVMGPAICNDRQLIMVGSVQTTHPEVGEEISDTPPPAPDKIRALLPKLADLPKEVEAKAKTEADLRAEIRALKLAATKQPAPAPAAPRPAITKTVEVPLLTKREMQRLVKLMTTVSKIHQHLEVSANKIGQAESAVIDFIKRVTRQEPPPTIRSFPVDQRTMMVNKSGLPSQALTFRKPTGIMKRTAIEATFVETNEELKLLAGERRMLGVLAQFHPGTRTKSQLGALIGLTPSGGTFSNYFGTLRRNKFITEAGNDISITAAGLSMIGNAIPETPKTPEEVVAMWRSKLLAGERRMLDSLLLRHPGSYTKDELGAMVRLESTGGTFSNYLGTLRRNDLAVVDGDLVKASEALFQVPG